MNFTVDVAPSTTGSRSLPALRGRLLYAYRAVWLLLLLGSAATLGWLVVSPGMGLEIMVLRLGKGAVLIAVSAILFRRRQRDMVAGLLSCAFLLWTITSSFDVTGGGAPLVAALADRLRFLLFALALLVFPSGRWTPDWTRHVALASAAVFLLGIAETMAWLQSQLFLPLAILCVLAAIGSLFHRFRSASQVERQQSKWIALGLSVGISLILAARAGAALRGRANLDPLLIEALFQVGVVAIAVGFLVSLLRYRLYDAEAVISRSAAYAGLTLSLVAIFTASEVLIENLGQNYLGSEIGNLAGALAAGVAAMLLAPLHDGLTKWAENHFQRDLAILKESLPELLAELSGLSSPRRIGHAALPRISGALHADRSALLIDGRVLAVTNIDARSVERWSKLWLSDEGATGFAQDQKSEFPLRLPLRCPFGSLRGWLLLGARPDGSPYSRDDLEALNAISRPLRTALFAARERERERLRDAAALRSLRRQVTDLAGQVASLARPAAAASGQ